MAAAGVTLSVVGHGENRRAIGSAVVSRLAERDQRENTRRVLKAFRVTTAFSVIVNQR